MTEFHLYLYGPNKAPLPSSFEDAADRLQQLPRLYFEPDGSFVWALDGGKQQVFGMLYDAGGRLQYVELRGRCDASTWRTIVAAITPDEPAGWQVVRLPGQQLQDLQDFESELPPGSSPAPS